MCQELISSYQKSIGCSINELALEILGVAKHISEDSQIIYRIKDPQILTQKMKLKKVSSIFEIDDVYALRILTPFVEKCYKIMDEIMKTFPSYLDHDFIANPKTRQEDFLTNKGGFRLIQIIARKNNTPFEVQITTFDFNEINESYHEEYHRRRYSLLTI